VEKSKTDLTAEENPSIGRRRATSSASGQQEDTSYRNQLKRGDSSSQLPTRRWRTGRRFGMTISWYDLSRGWMRQDGLISLRWSDMELDNRLINVQNSEVFPTRNKHNWRDYWGTACFHQQVYSHIKSEQLYDAVNKLTMKIYIGGGSLTGGAHGTKTKSSWCLVGQSFAEMRREKNVLHRSVFLIILILIRPWRGGWVADTSGLLNRRRV